MAKSLHFPPKDWDFLPDGNFYDPHQALLFDGSNSLLPTVAFGSILFNGAKESLGGKKQPFELKYDRILGYDVHCCQPSTTKKVRIKCCPINECTSDEFATIELQFYSTPEFPIGLQYGLENDRIFVSLVEDCGASDCCRVISALANQINGKGNNYPVKATAIKNSANEWFLDIEAKNAGQDFKVIGVENLSQPTLLSPNYVQKLTAKSIANWFDSPLVTDCDPDKCMEVVEIRYKEFLPHAEGGFIGSPNGQMTGTVNLPVDNLLPLVFDPSNPVSQAYKAALFNLLELNGVAASVKPFLQVKGNKVCKDGPFYSFCVTRTDAGDDAAIVTLKADYGAATAYRTQYKAGVSTYTISVFNVATAPTAVGADTVVVGSCGGTCIAGECPDLVPCSSC
jgi:hypothetical protein